MATAAQLAIDTSADAMQLAETLFGQGIQIISASYTGDPLASGVYTGADTTMPGVAPSDSGVILSTGYAEFITNATGGTDTNQSDGTGMDNAGVDADPELNAESGQDTYDAAIFEASFIPDGDYITMRFVFASEEYPEYVGLGVNDVFGVWINGEYVEATVVDGGRITIDNVNGTANQNLYVDNTSDQYNTEMDGFTYVLSIKAKVVPGEINTIKIAIADGGDSAYDSNVMIAADSIQSFVLAHDDTVQLVAGGTRVVDVLANDTDTTGNGLTITEIMGQPVSPGDSVTLATGETVTLNPDGTLTVVNGSTLGSNSMTYTVVDSEGNIDTGFLEITTVAVAGPDYVVQGTDGDDVIDGAYTQDPDGDLIDASDNQTGTNDDLVYAGDGNDVVMSGTGSDTVYGGSGNDTISATGGENSLFGGTGDDQISGSLGNDTLYGDSGNDFLFGNEGNDSLYGGAGNDVFLVNNSDGSDRVYGGEGTDSLVFGSTSTMDSVNVIVNEENTGTYEFTEGGADGTFASIEQFSLTGGNDTADASLATESVSIFGNNGDDYIAGGSGADALYGGEGDDQIVGGLGNDTISGGEGDDYIESGPAFPAFPEYTLLDGETQDLTGTNGNGDFSHSATSSNGTVDSWSVTIDGGWPMDGYHVGNGADANETHSHVFSQEVAGAELSFADLDPTETVIIWLDGVAVNLNDAIADGLVSFDPGTTGYYIDASGALATATAPVSEPVPATLVINVPFTTLDVQNVSPTGAGNGTVYALAVDTNAPSLYDGDDDSVTGDAGNDQIMTGSGDDIAYGGTGDDTLDGGSGNDTLYGDEGNDLLEGAEGNDQLFGGEGDDELNGGEGADTLEGGEGNDTLNGGGGNDLLSGQGGDDLFTLQDEGGNDTIIGGETGEIAGDTLDASGVTSDVYLDLTAGTFTDPESGTLTIGDGATPEAVVQFSEIENIILGAGNDYVLGSDGNDNVATGAGSDTVMGREGDDTFDLGSDGDADLVIFSDAHGKDTISGFDAPLWNGYQWVGTDQLDVSALHDAGGDPVNTADVTVETGDDGDAVLLFPNGERLTLIGVDPALAADPYYLEAMGIPLGSVTPPNYIVEGTGDDDFINEGYLGDPEGDLIDAYDNQTGGNEDLVYGYDGNDTIISGLGNDTVYGGDDNDLVNAGAGDDEVHGEAGDDTISGGSGNDTVYGDAGNDALYGGVGDDSLFGGEGDDSLYGGAGADTLDGGLGDDWIEGGRDDDTITDMEGDNTVYGGNGADTITTGSGDDLIYGGTPPMTEEGTVVWASTQNGDLVRIDNIDGVATATIVGPMGVTMGDIGMAPDGTLYGVDMVGGFYEIDTVTGTASRVIDSPISGSNSLSFDSHGIGYTGGGSSTIYAFDPADPATSTAWWTNPDGGSPAGDFIFIGDTAYVSWTNGLYALSLGPENEVLSHSYLGTLPGTSYGLTADDEGALYVVANGANGNALYKLDVDAATGVGAIPTTYVPGSNTPSSQYWGATSNVEAKLAPAADGADVIHSGEGNDTVYGMLGNDSILGEAGEDSLFGDEGDDSLYGGIDNDSLYGGIGNDQLSGGDGNDVLEGGDGNDLVMGDHGDDLLYGGDGDDTLWGGEDNDTVYGGDGNDSVSGAAGNDLLYGDAGNDSMEGREGDDTLYGGSGDDLISGGADNDSMFGGEGNDMLFAQEGNDTVFGDEGNDLIEGDAGDDLLYGGDGVDQIYGGAGNDTIYGGPEGDWLYGGADQDTFLNVTIGDVVDGGSDGDDWDVLDLSDWGPDRTNIIYDPLNHENGTVEFLDEDGLVIGTMTFTEIEKVIPCFTPGAMIATDRGEVRVEDLQPGDRVLTRDHGYQEVRWAGRRRLSAAELAAAPQLAPVRIGAGALGPNLPERALTVSPQHRMLFTGPRAELLFGEHEVLVAALHLVGRPGIKRSEQRDVTYIHIMFDRHEIIRADGAWTESYQPGSLTIAGMEDAQRTELLSIFPELATGAIYAPARTSLKRHEAELLHVA